MGFSESYLRKFYNVSENLCSKYGYSKTDDIEIGKCLTCPYPPAAIIDVMDIWVAGVDKLLRLTQDSTETEYSTQFTELYRQRGITFDEYYYLFSDSLSEAEYLKTPAYIFTRTYSKDLRNRRFRDYKFSEESYKDFILALDIAPSHFFRRQIQARIAIEAVLAHSYCVAKTRSGKTELLKLVIYNLLKHKQRDTSILVLDPHGEFARELRRLRILDEKIEDFIYVDPTLDGEHTPVFNPFEIKDKSTVSLAYAADTILDAFEQLLKDQTITGNMRRLLRHCIYAMLYYDGTTMMDLLTLLQGINRNKSQRVPEFFPEEERLMNLGRSVPDPLTNNFFNFGWKDVDSRTVSAVVERIDGILSHPIVRRFMIGPNGQSSFDLKSYLNSGKIVVVNLDFTRLGNIGSEAIGRLWFLMLKTFPHSEIGFQENIDLEL